MSFSIKCPTCKKPLSVAREQLEEKLVCPNCKAQFRVKAPPGKTPAPAGTTGPMPPPRKQPPLRPSEEQEEGTMLGQPLPQPAPPQRNGPPPLKKRGGTTPAPRPPKLTPPKKSNIRLIALIVVLILGAGAGGWFLYDRYGKQKPEQAKQQPTPPVATALGKFGGIEIGSSGVKMVALELFETDEGVKYSILGKEVVNTNLAKLKADSTFEPRLLERTIGAAKTYFDVCVRDHGIPTENVHVMCSSGIFSQISDKAIAEKNIAQLKEEVKAKVGKDLDVVDAKKEAMFSLIAIVPKKDWADTIIIDVGSGNTKGGGFENKVFLDIEMKYGAKTYAAHIKETKPPADAFAKALEEKLPTEVVEPLRREISQTRTLQNRKKVQLIGGAVWAMATFTHPEKQLEKRSTLSGGDIRTFLSSLKEANAKKLSETVLAKAKALGDEALFTQVENDVKAQMKIFDPDELLAGAAILAVVNEEFQLETKTIEFFRLGQYAWLLGFVLDKSGLVK